MIDFEVSEIQSDIAEIENSAALFEAANFARRVEAIDDLEFHVLDRIAGLLNTAHPPAELISLQQKAESVRRRLEQVDERLFQQLRNGIRAGAYTGVALRDLIEAYVESDPIATIGYDSLDVFVNRLLRIEAAPGETRAREPEMVFYQPTPARIMLALVEKARLTRDDVFYDLGSGLGHVPIVVNLLSGAPSRGVEFDPAYCEYARRCAADLNLSQVTFINADARRADYADGTTFFLYTPFTGSILQDVMERLRHESRSRAIRVFTYGPCTPYVAMQPWLTSDTPTENYLYELGVFRSLPPSE